MSKDLREQRDGNQNLWGGGGGGRGNPFPLSHPPPSVALTARLASKSSTLSSNGSSTSLTSSSAWSATTWKSCSEGKAEVTVVEVWISRAGAAPAGVTRGVKE